jgi:histidinol-phosphate aminotransferase
VRPPQPRPDLRELEPYAAPQLDVEARLNTNECPYPLPEGFRIELADAVRALTLNRYPDREALELRSRLAELNGHDPDGTWVANGSNEILQQLLQAYGGPGRRVALFDPTYAMHERTARVTSSLIVHVPLEPPWRITSAEMARTYHDGPPSVVFVCSPNNPTGNAQDPQVIGAEAELAPDILFIVDEAYIEFGGESMAPLVHRFRNVVVVRTFSKAFALAGARIGYCLASPEVVRDLRRVRLPYHLSALTQAAGVVALRHREEALSILDAVREQRDRILAALPALGVQTHPSDANFVLFRPPEDAAAVWQGLLDRGVLVRDFTSVIPGALRVTAGTREEVGLFLSALEEALA